MSMYMTVLREDDVLGKNASPRGEVGELRALSVDAEDGGPGFRKGHRRFITGR
jgi:hypothetical protein